MFKKIIIALIILGVVVFGYWAISPLFINKVVDEKLPESSDVSKYSLPDEPKKLASGSFVGFDKLHDGKGEVSVYEIDSKKILRFEEGFQVNNGPDLYVGFGKSGEYVKGSEISKLKGNIGSQNYDIPDNFDLSSYDSVYVWCKAFSVPFIKADLLY